MQRCVGQKAQTGTQISSPEERAEAGMQQRGLTQIADFQQPQIHIS